MGRQGFGAGRRPERAAEIIILATLGRSSQEKARSIDDRRHPQPSRMTLSQPKKTAETISLETRGKPLRFDGRVKNPQIPGQKTQKSPGNPQVVFKQRRPGIAMSGQRHKPELCYPNNHAANAERRRPKASSCRAALCRLTVGRTSTRKARSSSGVRLTRTRPASTATPSWL